MAGAKISGSLAPPFVVTPAGSAPGGGSGGGGGGGSGTNPADAPTSGTKIALITVLVLALCGGLGFVWWRARQSASASSSSSAPYGALQVEADDFGGANVNTSAFLPTAVADDADSGSQYARM